jgi:formiminotetrahydrofolate cyclodeaminase
LKLGIDEFLSQVASAQPTPGGGSVAALAGSLAAALGEMMSGLTEGRPAFAFAEERVRKIHEALVSLRAELGAIVQEDSAAFKTLLNAIRLPRNTSEEKAVRDEAIQRATRVATETPLRTARACSQVLEHLKVLAEIGNPNAKCDVAVGAQLAYASLKGSQYNILANIIGLKDTLFSEKCRAETSVLVQKGERTLRQIDAMVVGS